MDRRIGLPLAFLATYLLWGGTFLAIRVAVESVPPFLLAGARFVLAATLAGLWLRVRRPRTCALSWPRATLTGALLFFAAHGLVTSMEVHVESGIAAIAMATIPVWMALMAGLVGGARPGPRGWIGLLLGLGAVAVLAWPAGTPDVRLPHALGLVGAAISWTIGSILTKRWGAGTDVLHTATRQMIVGAGLLLGFSAARGEAWLTTTPAWSAMAALAFLVLGGSLAAYLAFLYLMEHTTVSRASSYAYVNPIVAVLLGALLLGEPVTWRILAATPMVVVAVLLTLWTRSHPIPPADSGRLRRGASGVACLLVDAPHRDG